ncbi:KR domain-containing protein, partial [Parabacteroides merdae]
MFGQINGVIHAAGTLHTNNFGLIRETSFEESKEQFNTKIYGTLVLSKVLKEHNVDIIILMSSLSSILGGLGHIVYSSANKFMDAFSQKCYRKNNQKWLTVNWDVWQNKVVEESILVIKNAIMYEEGNKAFDYIIANETFPQILVSTTELQERIDNWLHFWEKTENLQKERVKDIHEWKDLENELARIFKEILGLETVNRNDNFFEMGATSLTLIQINEQIRRELKLNLTIEKLFTYPTIYQLINFLKEDDAFGVSFKNDKKKNTVISHSTKDIAVIGMSGRFPGAKNISEYWENIKNGLETISEFTDQELWENGVSKEEMYSEYYVRRKGVIQNVEKFDPETFGYNLNEAELMDPQMRIFHECTWEALEDAGYNPQIYNGKIGLYGGAATTHWPYMAMAKIASNPAAQFNAVSLTDKDFIFSKIAYNLNLHGPCVSVQTGCSTSLVALHQACQGIQNGECEMAIAGGVYVSVPQKIGYLYQAGMLSSPDGHCRAFDHNANGTLFSEGAGVVVLKNLEQALEDGDHIYAVIKGSAINNDGNRKVGYTAPSTKGQYEVIHAAIQESGISPENIDYIEAHGTATHLGDPIEIEALKQAF